MVRCWYCGRPAVMKTGAEVYGQPALKERKLWVCEPCGAWVGCHPGTEKPLGELAKEDLRILRAKAHKIMDRFRHLSGFSRSKAYRFLREAMGMTADRCHIGMFNEEQCVEAMKHMLLYTEEIR